MSDRNYLAPDPLDGLDEDYARDDGTRPNGHSAAEPKPRRVRLMRLDELDPLAAELTLIEGLLGPTMFGLLYGESGTGKSLTAVDVALRMPLGWRWNGRRLKKAPSVYLAPEGAHSIALRTHAWCIHHHVDRSTIPIRVVPVRIDLCHGDTDTGEIIQAIKEAEAEIGKAGAVFVDTVSRAMGGGDENSPADMGAFVSHCDAIREETQAAVIAVHHCPHGGNKPRGHTSLMNAADLRAEFTKIARGLFNMNIRHVKDGASSDEEILIGLETVEVCQGQYGPLTGGVAVEARAEQTNESGGRPHAGKLTAKQTNVLTALAKHCDQTKVWDVSFDQFREICIKAGAVDGDKPENNIRARVSDMRDQLSAKGLISVDGKAKIIRRILQP